MYLFFQKDVRGGVSYISKRCSKANNKYLKFYVSRQESKYIMYLDVNKLYAYAMFKFYPTSGLNGETLKSLTQVNIGVIVFIGVLILNIIKNYLNYIIRIL